MPQFAPLTPHPSLTNPNPNTGKMSASKNSAVSEDPVDVLIVLHEKFDLLDFAGVTKVLDSALHNKSDPSECCRVPLSIVPHMV